MADRRLDFCQGLRFFSLFHAHEFGDQCLLDNTRSLEVSSSEIIAGVITCLIFSVSIKLFFLCPPFYKLSNGVYDCVVLKLSAYGAYIPHPTLPIHIKGNHANLRIFLYAWRQRWSAYYRHADVLRKGFHIPAGTQSNGARHSPPRTRWDSHKCTYYSRL